MIDRKLKMGEYRTFNEYEKDIKIFYNYFIDTGPRFTNRNTIILEFLHRALSEGASLFVRMIGSESDMIKNVTSET